MKTTETKEWTNHGYDLVMTSERGGWTCSIYRIGGQVPLSRRRIDGKAERAEKWLDGMAANMQAAQIGKGGN